MTWEITTPNGNTFIKTLKDQSDVEYVKGLTERGYKVREIKLQVIPEARCTACEG